METKGESLLEGPRAYARRRLEGAAHPCRSRARSRSARNIAMTPGKVVKQTPLYQLIQYSPTTDEVLETPLIIFPPWINRFYILDLNPKKSFIRWAVEQGLTVFVVSWKSADESLADTMLDDYVLRGQVDAIDAVRDAARRRERCTPSAIASPARCSPRPSLCSRRGARRTRSRAPPSSPPRSISPKPATSTCSSATSSWS